MTRRRPTAVIGNYFPLDKKENKTMARGVPGSSLRGGPVPSAPTGRLVITNRDGVKNGGVQNTHWCPKPGGEWPEWSCPDEGCNLKFRYDQGSKSWQAVL